MFRRNCGGQMNDNQAICLKCGVETGKGNAFCSNCGSPVGAEAAVCLNCGVAINKSLNSSGLQMKNENYLDGHDKMVIAILCFFFGGIGVHNFVLREKKKGIFKIIMLLCCGVSFILAIIDFIRILIGSYVVDPNKLI